jgi:hypothetical protein
MREARNAPNHPEHWSPAANVTGQVQRKESLPIANRGTCPLCGHASPAPGQTHRDCEQREAFEASL